MCNEKLLALRLCCCCCVWDVSVSKDKSAGEVATIISEKKRENCLSNATVDHSRCDTSGDKDVFFATTKDKCQPKQEMNILHHLALNSLDLTVPAASDFLLRNRKNTWFQLSGHEGAFAPAGPGTIWKRHSPSDDTEAKAYLGLMKDPIRDVVPIFYKEVEFKSEYYIEMQDLLSGFCEPSVMDIKMGSRTFTESEVKNQTPRADLYQKLLACDPEAATLEERQAGAITKLRYMEFREKLSSTSTLGFRIEAIKYGQMAPIKDCKLIKSQADIHGTLKKFFANKKVQHQQVLNRLKTMRNCFEQSPFCQRHEILGSSILIIHDESKASAWMIDFAKTIKLPEGVSITHRKPWLYGNHEDGYLTGLDNLIEVFENVIF